MPPHQSDEETERSDLFAGRFEILEKIGEGATGDVFKVKDNVLKRIAAIKLMRFRQSDDRKVMRFQREAKAASKLTHGGLIEVFDFGIADDGTPYLVMEFINGRSLDAVLSECGTLDVNRALNIASMTAEAMHYAHESKVVHRDLKPSNIMLIQTGEQEHVKVIDFGMATILEDEGTAGGETLKSSSRGIGGTPNYMSPEQASKTGVDERADIYSLGCILFTLITGRPPYLATTTMESVELHRNAPIPILESFASDVKLPGQLNAIIIKMLAKDKTDRFKSMSEVQTALGTCVSEELENSETLGDPEAPLTITSKRHGRISLQMMLNIGLLVCGTLALSYFYFMPPQVVQSSDPRETVALLKDSFPDSFANNDSTGDFNMVASMAGDGPAKGKIPIGTSLRVAGDEISDSTIENLISGNPELQRISIVNTKVSDQTIKEIARGQKIVAVYLEQCPNLTDDGLKPFVAMKNLNSLSLRGTTGISDRGMDTIASCRGLTQLVLANNQRITVRGVEKLSKLPALFQISIGDIAMKGKDYLVLKKFKSLVLLSFDLGTIDVEDMKSIRELKFIKRVSLTDGSITDEALLLLADMPNLRDIRLAGTKGFSQRSLALLRARVGNRCLIETSENYRELTFGTRSSK